MPEIQKFDGHKRIDIFVNGVFNRWTTFETSPENGVATYLKQSQSDSTLNGEITAAYH